MQTPVRTFWAIVSLVLITFFFAAWGGLSLHSSHMFHTQMPMSECPFSFTEVSVCAKNIAEYLEELSWSYVKLFSFVIFGTIIFYVLERKLFVQTYKKIRYRCEPLYQQLFSEGILNPKAP